MTAGETNQDLFNVQTERKGTDKKYSKKVAGKKRIVERGVIKQEKGEKYFWGRP